MKQAPRAKASPAAGGCECAEQALVGRAEPAVQQGSVHDKHVQLRIFSARCGFLGTEPHRKPRSIYLESRTALSTTPPPRLLIRVWPVSAVSGSPAGSLSPTPSHLGRSARSVLRIFAWLRRKADETGASLGRTETRGGGRRCSPRNLEQPVGLAPGLRGQVKPLHGLEPRGVAERAEATRAGRLSGQLSQRCPSPVFLPGRSRSPRCRGSAGTTKPPLQTGAWSSLPRSSESEFQLGATYLSHLCPFGHLLGITVGNPPSSRSTETHPTAAGHSPRAGSPWPTWGGTAAPHPPPEGNRPGEKRSHLEPRTHEATNLQRARP